MGGNGDYVSHKGGMVGSKNAPPGQGGGCVTKGPFGKYVLHLIKRLKPLLFITFLQTAG